MICPQLVCSWDVADLALQLYDNMMFLTEGVSNLTVRKHLQGAGRPAPQSGTGQGQRAASQAAGSPGQSPHKVTR